MRVAFLLMLLLTTCTGGDDQTMSDGSGKGQVHQYAQVTLADARSWAYQLQHYPHRLRGIAASPFEVVIVDPAADGSRDKWSPDEITAARRNRLLLAYLSIGEAEVYRPYWQPGWAPGTPGWLLWENPDWAGNYTVEYWNPDWQEIILSFLDEILAQGFDGVYLDLVDAYSRFPERRRAPRDMVAWVCRLSRHARAQAPGFLIVPQNAAELIWQPGYSDCIDGTGQEETFYRATNRPTSAAERRERLRHYAEFLRRGKPVFTVDYVDTPTGIRDVYSQARAAHLIPYAADVNLDRLRVNPGFDPP